VGSDDGVVIGLKKQTLRRDDERRRPPTKSTIGEDVDAGQLDASHLGEMSIVDADPGDFFGVDGPTSATAPMTRRQSVAAAEIAVGRHSGGAQPDSSFLLSYCR
jgi:hypothetical protein